MSLTTHQTRDATSPCPADPERVVPESRNARTAALLLAGSLTLGAVLAVPDDLPSATLGPLAGGAWLTLVLGMTLPTRRERVGCELARRLGAFRHEVTAAGDDPTREELDRLVALARDLPDDEIAHEIGRIHACLDALALREALTAGAWPSAVSPDPLFTSDTCHFVCPVRFGRRQADQCGHLVLTRLWLKFRGALDVSVSWSEVVRVERAERELIVTLKDSRRMLRFSCQTLEAAARGRVLATELARLAAAGTKASGSAGASFEAV